MCRQIQEDLPQEKEDNAVEPEKKKEALKAILADYNTRYGSNHSIGEFDLYYQDVQKRIKDQQWPNADRPHTQKIDITIVVEMLLTGFDSKYLNTLYVDKKLIHHGLIQAFSRTNRMPQRHKALRQHPRFPPAAGGRRRRHHSILWRSRQRKSPRNLACGKGPCRHQKTGRGRAEAGRLMKSQGLDCAGGRA